MQQHAARLPDAPFETIRTATERKDFAFASGPSRCPPEMGWGMRSQRGKRQETVSKGCTAAARPYGRAGIRSSGLACVPGENGATASRFEDVAAMDDVVARPAFRDDEPVGFKDWTEELQARPRSLLRWRCEEPSVV